jgi:pimeloyl-ACP methyl ester carboxylesterase
MVSLSKALGVVALVTVLISQGCAANVRRVDIQGTDLTYVDAGHGDPIIFVHGGLQDYRYWDGHVGAFAKRYRAIAYSRRNHFPNAVSGDGVADIAGDIHGDDLAAFIKALGLSRPHIVGHSSGALAALFFAAKYPGVARTLVLNEPPAFSVLLAAAGGRELVKETADRFAAGRDAFRNRDVARAMPLWIDAMGGPPCGRQSGQRAHDRSRGLGGAASPGARRHAGSLPAVAHGGRRTGIGRPLGRAPDSWLNHWCARQESNLRPSD